MHCLEQCRLVCEYPLLTIFALIASSTLSIMNSLTTSLLMWAIGFTSHVPVCPFTLLLLARSSITREKHPIFPSKIQTPPSNIGQPRTPRCPPYSSYFCLYDVDHLHWATSNEHWVWTHGAQHKRKEHCVWLNRTPDRCQPDRAPDPNKSGSQTSLLSIPGPSIQT
jgi:hypothetical protein